MKARIFFMKLRISGTSHVKISGSQWKPERRGINLKTYCNAYLEVLSNVVLQSLDTFFPHKTIPIYNVNLSPHFWPHWCRHSTKSVQASGGTWPLFWLLGETVCHRAKTKPTVTAIKQMAAWCRRAKRGSSLLDQLGLVSATSGIPHSLSLSVSVLFLVAVTLSSLPPSLLLLQRLLNSFS